MSKQFDRFICEAKDSPIGTQWSPVEGIVALIKSRYPNCDAIKFVNSKNPVLNFEVKVGMKEGAFHPANVLSGEDYANCQSKEALSSFDGIQNGHYEFVVMGKTIKYKADLLTDAPIFFKSDKLLSSDDIVTIRNGPSGDPDKSPDESANYSERDHVQFIKSGKATSDFYRPAYLFMFTNDHTVIHGPAVYPAYKKLGTYSLKTRKHDRLGYAPSIDLWAIDTRDVDPTPFDLEADYYFDFIKADKSGKIQTDPVELVSNLSATEIPVHAKTYLGSLFWCSLFDLGKDQGNDLDSEFCDKDVSDMYATVTTLIKQYNKELQTKAIHIPLLVEGNFWRNEFVEKLYDLLSEMTRCSQRLNLLKLFQVSEHPDFNIPICIIAGLNFDNKLSTSPGRIFFMSTPQLTEDGGLLALSNAYANSVHKGKNPSVIVRLLSLLAVSTNRTALSRCDSKQIEGARNDNTSLNVEGKKGLIVNNYEKGKKSQFTPFSLDSRDRKYVGLNVMTETDSRENGMFVVKVDGVVDGHTVTRFFSVVCKNGEYRIVNDSCSNQFLGKELFALAYSSEQYSFYRVETDRAFDQSDNLIVQKYDDTRLILDKDEYELVPGGARYV